MNTKHIYAFEDDEVLTLNGLEIGRIHADLEVKDELIRRLNCHEALTEALQGLVVEARLSNAHACALKALALAGAEKDVKS